MPILFLEAENVIERIHRSAVISYRNIIKKMDTYKAQHPGTSDIEAAHLVAAELGVETELPVCSMYFEDQSSNKKEVQT